MSVSGYIVLLCPGRFPRTQWSTSATENNGRCRLITIVTRLWLATSWMLEYRVHCRNSSRCHRDRHSAARSRNAELDLGLSLRYCKPQTWRSLVARCLWVLFTKTQRTNRTRLYTVKKTVDWIFDMILVLCVTLRSNQLSCCKRSIHQQAWPLSVYVQWWWWWWCDAYNTVTSLSRTRFSSLN